MKTQSFEAVLKKYRGNKVKASHRCSLNDSWMKLQKKKNRNCEIIVESFDNLHRTFLCWFSLIPLGKFWRKFSTILLILLRIFKLISKPFAPVIGRSAGGSSYQTLRNITGRVFFYLSADPYASPNAVTNSLRNIWRYT